MNVYKQAVKILIVSFLFFISIAAICADDNVTGDNQIDVNQTEKIMPVISINSTSVVTGDSVGIYLKDENETAISNKNLTVNINKKNSSLISDSEGKYSLKLNLKANKYLLSVIFNGDENYSSVNQTFNITVLKKSTSLIPVNKTVIKGKYCYVTLKDQYGIPIGKLTVSFKVNGKTYKSTTNSNGIASLKITLNPKKYPISVSFAGNDYYKAISNIYNLTVKASTSLVIGNSRILSNGFLRVYLKSDVQSVISKKTVIITVGAKKFTKTTNSEGAIVIYPNVGVGKFNISVNFSGDSKSMPSTSFKQVSGVKGSVKNPFKSKIPLKNGIPDIDVMPGNYILANGDLKYTVTKVQYREVIQRDSYCLYLNNKLSKFTFFKSKAEPKINHVIQREKWNVIEKVINTKIVKKNKKGYWPSQVTVSLKGKSCTYCEVRDKQNNDYTCAPTSASMCSQVLRCYVSEKQFAKQAGTIIGFGTKCQWIKKALEKNHFKCSYFTKKTYNNALKQLKKGGCALIFHANNHYVAILDISKDGKKVLVSNSYGRYDAPGANLPNKWLSVKHVKSRFCTYDQRSLIVKLKYNLKKSTKNNVNNFYSSMGTKWVRQNTNERILDIGL